MKSINTVVNDIYQQVGKKDGWFGSELAQGMARDITTRLEGQLGTRKEASRLRLSQMGPRCPKALWLSVHEPGSAEALPPWAEIKYSYGHILEALALSLAKAAGHDVKGEQDEVTVDGIVGHRDAVLDGCILDVKSTSGRAFQKFKSGALKNDDSFGYLEQLDGYLVGSLDDPLVTVKDRAYILAINRDMGHMCLYEHFIREQHIRDRIRSYKEIVGRATPPECGCGTRLSGASGNIELDVKASYSAFKWSCFPQLRVFLYASGPVYLTKVVRKPEVIEIDKHGKAVYNR